MSSKIFTPLLSACLMLILSCTGTKTDKNANNTDNNEQKVYKFPDDWFGTYKGEMNWYVGSKLQAKVPIAIQIFPDSANPKDIIWRTTYDSTAAVPFKVVKDYTIIKPDSLKNGHYLMDEKNGIYLDMRLIDNTLYSCFDVRSYNSTSRLISIETLLPGKNLYHEVISYKEPDKKSGDSGASEGFSVRSTSEISTQKATLKLMKR